MVTQNIKTSTMPTGRAAAAFKFHWLADSCGKLSYSCKRCTHAHAIHLPSYFLVNLQQRCALSELAACFVACLGSQISPFPPHFCPAEPTEGFIKPEVKEEPMCAYNCFDASPVELFSEVRICERKRFRGPSTHLSSI